MTLTPFENYQIYPIIRGGEHAYSRIDTVEGKSRVLRSGHQTILASAVQVRNLNHREYE